MNNSELLQKIEKLENEMAAMKASRGLRAFFRRAISRTSFIVGVTLAAALTGFLAWAAQNAFIDGTVISAADVNNNFNELYAAKWGVNGSNFYYNGGNVGVGTDTPGEILDVNGRIIRSIYHATGKQPDGADTGYVLGRTITIDKKKSATSIRVLYSDNFRVTGTGRACRWEVRFDDASCPGGIIAWDKYESLAANDHEFNTIVGYCSGLSVGSHTMKVYVSSSPSYSGCDCYTGWSPDGNSAAWVLEAEEVY